MSTIEAIYQGGVFKPLGEVTLHENQRVQLHVHPIEEKDVRAWLERVNHRHQQIIETQGYFPDSTPDMAADRARDE